MSTEEQKLGEIRKKIDAIDAQLQSLLNQRAQCAMDVATVKLEARKDPSEPVVFYRPEREAQVIRRVMERNEGPLRAEQVAHLIREVMSACLALEETLNVAFLGPDGTFTQAAALKQFGAAVETVPCASINKIFEAVEDGSCRYGVVPIENSTEGPVNITLDCLANSRLKICGEVELPIHLHLMALRDVDITSVSKVCAHQQALAQARHWLDQNMPNVPRVAVSSNGEAAAMAAKDSSIAAIAGDVAMSSYPLVSLSKNIEDLHDNTTRFVVVSAGEVSGSGKDKTCLMVSARNESGALLTLLQPFSEAGINMTRLISRPSRTETWAYVFFVEFEGHIEDGKIASIIDGLESTAFTIKHLGSYPEAAF